MSIMGEPIPRPIEKIPGVKPPIGLETRPAPTIGDSRRTEV